MCITTLFAVHYGLGKHMLTVPLQNLVPFTKVSSSELHYYLHLRSLNLGLLRLRTHLGGVYASDKNLNSFAIYSSFRPTEILPNDRICLWGLDCMLEHHGDICVFFPMHAGLIPMG